MVKDEVIYKTCNYIINKMLNLDVEGLPNPKTQKENIARNAINAFWDQLQQDNVYISSDELKPQLYEWIKENIVLQVMFVDNGRGVFNPSFCTFMMKGQEKRNREDLINVDLSLPASALRETLKAELEKYPHFFNKPRITARHLKG